MGDQKQSFLSARHHFLQKFKGALGIFCIQISGWLVGKDDTWIIRQRARDRDPLLFPAGKMAARSCDFVSEIDRFEQFGRMLTHLVFSEPSESAHRDHDIFLRGKILH